MMTSTANGALSHGPGFFEECYVFRIPTHGRYYTPTTNYRLVASRMARQHRAGAPALLTPLQPRPTSALVRYPDSSRTSREVRNVPNADIALLFDRTEFTKG
jgi:hypothetical protein